MHFSDLVLIVYTNWRTVPFRPSVTPRNSTVVASMEPAALAGSCIVRLSGLSLHGFTKGILFLIIPWVHSPAFVSFR